MDSRGGALPSCWRPRDLGLLSGELIPGLDAAFADVLACGQELALGPRGERSTPIAGEQLERGTQLLARVRPTAFAP